MNIYEMTDKQFDAYLLKIKPTLPPWNQEGCSVLDILEERFIDRNGNKALIKYVYWKDKKNKQHKSVVWVRWQ